MATLLNATGKWTDRERQKHHAFSFQVPEGALELSFIFRWRPHEVQGNWNLLALSVFDPSGFRGADHSEQTELEVRVGEDTATPGFLPGPIPAGEWTLGIDAHEILNNGAESGYLEFELTASALLRGPKPERLSHARPEPPAAEADRTTPALATEDAHGRWYRGDLHSHTDHSDGHCTVAERARAAAERGLDFLALTDHNTISSNRVRDPWPERLVRIRGSEVTTFHGHLNVLGIDEWIDWRDEPAEAGARRILAQAARQDAIAVVNHPMAIGNPYCTGCHWDFRNVDWSQFGAVEVWNGAWRTTDADNPAALRLWTQLLNDGARVAAVAGTDSHTVEDHAKPDAPFTHVFAAARTEAAILDAIRAGRVYLSSGPLLGFRARTYAGEAHAPGAELRHDGQIDLQVTVAALSVPATLWLVSDGKRTNLAVIDPPGASVERPDAAVGEWWRLELRESADVDGTLLALTNPVFAETS